MQLVQQSLDVGMNHTSVQAADTVASTLAPTATPQNALGKYREGVPCSRLRYAYYQG